MFVTDFVQIFCFWSSFLAAELTRTRGHKWVVVRSGLLLFFVVQIVSFLQCSIFLKIKNPWLDLSLPNRCASACHSFWREAGPVWHVRQRCWHVLYLFFFQKGAPSSKSVCYRLARSSSLAKYICRTRRCLTNQNHPGKLVLVHYHSEKQQFT